MSAEGYRELSQSSPFLQPNEDIPENDDYDEKSSTEKRKLQRLVYLQWILLLVLSVIAFGLSVALWGDTRIRIPNFNYSPAQHLVRYKEVTFVVGFTHKTPYMGPPTAENEEAWEELYNYGIVKIPKDDAKKLDQPTVPKPDDPRYYVLGIDVFHQLHCLNNLRKKAWGEEMEHDMVHMDHCIDSIRQSLMCSSDISTIHFNWNGKDQKALPDARTVHTCRDFEAIRGWAYENRVGEFNTSIHAPDPLFDRA